MKTIFAGFSGNAAEHQYLDGSLGNKRGVIKRSLFLEGSSINASREIERCFTGVKVLLNLLVSESEAGDSGRFFLDKCLKQLPNLIQVNEIPVLKECNHSIVLHRPEEDQEHDILGYKGMIVDALVKKTCAEIIPIAEKADLLLLTSLRPVEMPFAKAALKSKKTAVVTLHREMFGDTNSLKTILSSGVNVVVLNQTEYGVMQDIGFNFAKIHGLGATLVVVTNKSREGSFSLNGLMGNFEVNPVKCENDDGAGDVFTGALASYMVKHTDWSNPRPCFDSLSNCKEMLNHAASRARKALLEQNAILPIT